MKISEVSEFSILPFVQNRKFWNLGKFSFASNFGISCNSRFKKRKKQELSQKFKDYLRCKTNFCHNLALHLKCTYFFIWRENNVLFSQYLDFCVFLESSSSTICDTGDQCRLQTTFLIISLEPLLLSR